MTTDTAALLTDLRRALGETYVLTGDATMPFRTDWMGDTRPEPLAVLRAPRIPARCRRRCNAPRATGPPSCRSPATPG
ncbi:hypothetical protein ACSQ76_19150 [Roseovarius sp. B08]|uniref:hypothetical protein n=1 Tax=Roseovarius sp. B08 TaxID=3449223 RepID=UPI003EDBCCF4